MNLKLNISTCPNDTFMFEAMLHGRIDTEGLVFDLHLADIEQLNGAALSGEPDISKLSYAAVPQISDRYKILNSGSALGRGNGPLLVSRYKIYPDELHDARVAIPGEHTTANLLLNKIYPSVKDRRAYLFSDIAEAVMTGECDAGVLIHEGRFVYRKIGLQLVADLGVEWEKTHRTAAAARGHRRIAAARRPTATENRPGIAPQHRICTWPTRRYRPDSSDNTHRN